MNRFAVVLQEDDITIDQLDFALKAVNNNLISDPEMDYVFHVSLFNN